MVKRKKPSWMIKVGWYDANPNDRTLGWIRYMYIMTRMKKTSIDHERWSLPCKTKANSYKIPRIEPNKKKKQQNGGIRTIIL